MAHLHTLLLVVALAGAWSPARADVSYEVKLEEHLSHLSEQRYPSTRFQAGREEARAYIKDRFSHYGYKVFEHHFNSSILNDQGLPERVEGVNIVAVLARESNQPGAVVLVGADYDTNGKDNPYFNNGAGVAAMLETARMFEFNTMYSGVWGLTYTTVFVAFDLNTKEHSNGPGLPGGRYFVHEWLWPFLNYSDVNFGGAIILDSIMNINYNPGSQLNYEKDDFNKVFPETYEHLVTNGGKGDFLGMVSAGGDEKTNTLRDQFSGNYYKAKKSQKFRLEDMALKQGVPYTVLTEEMLKPETFHFWSFNVNGTAKPLPAILLTDTQGDRADPETPDGCERSCPGKAWQTEERTEFMEATVTSLTSMLMSRQGYRTPAPPSSAWTSLPSVLTTSLMVLLVRLYL